MMQRCESCGLDLPLSAHFCTNCGKLLPDRTQAATDFTNPPATGFSSPNTPPLFSSPTYPGMSGAGMDQEDSGATFQASWSNAEMERNNPQFLERQTDEDERVQPEILLPWMLPFEGQLPSAGQAPMVAGTPQVGGVPSIQGTPVAPGNAPLSGPGFPQGAGSSAPPQAPNWAPHTVPHQPVYHPQPQPPLHHPQPVHHPQPEHPLHHPQPEPTHEPKHHHHSGPLHARREHAPRHHSSTAGLTSKAGMGIATKWIIVAIAAAIVIATSSILLTHAFVPTNPPGLTFTGSNVVRDRGILHLHGQGFTPGGSITLTIDNGLLVSLPGRPGTQAFSQRTGGSTNVTGLSQLFIAGALQPRSTAATNITVSSSGTFDANITVPPSLPAGKHTIHAMENQGSQSASLQFTVSSSELAVNPMALNFGSIEVGRKVALSVTVSNQGGSSLHWTATVDGSNTSWLTIQTNTGSIEANAPAETITVTADTNGLQVGTYSAILHFHSDSGDVQVAVRLNAILHAQGSQQAILNVPQQNLDLGQLQTGQQVQQSISIANLGNLPLKWLASTSATNAGWLSLAPTSGTVQPGATPQTVQVYINSTVLAAGSFSGTINITSNGGNANVMVTFTLTAVTPTPSPSPSPTQSPSPSPSPSQTPILTWSVSTASLDSGTCGLSSPCTVTLTEDASSTGNINWSASSDVGATFNPPGGPLSPGGQQQVSISGMACQKGTFTFAGSGGANPLRVSWTCTPTPPPTPSPTPTPQITVTPLKLDQTSNNCSQNSDGTYNCSVTVSETSPGNLNWFAPTGIGGTTVSFNPPSGQLTSSQTQQPVTISSIPCSNASFTFTDQNNNTATVTWSCTPPPSPTPSPVLTVTATGSCPSDSSGNYICTDSLAVTGSQGSISWSVSAESDLPGTTFNPPNGTLSVGQSPQSVTVTIPGSDCPAGGHYDYSWTGSNTSRVTFTCPTPTPQPPTLTVNPTSLSDLSGSPCTPDSTGNIWSCTVTVMETSNSQGNLTWSVSSDISGVSFTPSTTTLSPGQSVSVTISNIPCASRGTFTFSGGANPIPVSWLCGS